MILPVLITTCCKCDSSFKNCRSSIERSIAVWLSNICDYAIQTNRRFTHNNITYEGDILIPEHKLIIELNGLYWHSEHNGKKCKTYHINKLKFFNEIGYEVINIFEDEWIFKSDIIKNKIKHKLNISSYTKIHARKCEIKKISNTECLDFFNSTHIQGHINASICYGAYFNNNLVAAMTFSKQRIVMNKHTSSNNIYELVRFSTHSDNLIVGIGGKLLNRFIKDVSPSHIISYADKRWTSKMSNVYQKLNFKLISHSPPNYWYVKKLTREYRFNYTKQKLIDDGNDPALTEWEIMKNNGFDRIWDCGHFKYMLTCK